jgi:uncharacterized protein (TIGR02466 family)
MEVKMYNVGGIPIMLYNTDRVVTAKEYETIIMHTYSAHMYNDVATPGLITECHYILEEQNMEELKSFCQLYLDKYVKETLCITDQFIITNSWATRNPIGATHHAHNHPNSIFSGVYYLDAESSEVTFEFESTISKYFRFTYNCSELNGFNSNSLTLSPRTGDFLIFPSWINHKVSANTGSNDRTVLAFNSFVSGKIGTPDTNTFINLNTSNH